MKIQWQVTASKDRGTNLGNKGRQTKMKNPKAVAKRIAELHNESVKPSVKRAEEVKRSAERASTVGEKVIRLVDNGVKETSARTVEESMEFNCRLLTIAHANANAYFDSRLGHGRRSPALYYAQDRRR
jgi:hypothetical protein